MKYQNTKRAVKVLPVQKDDYVVWDKVLSQLGRRIRKSRETWIVQARVEGKIKRRTLGACAKKPMLSPRPNRRYYTPSGTQE